MVKRINLSPPAICLLTADSGLHETIWYHEWQCALTQGQKNRTCTTGLCQSFLAATLRSSSLQGCAPFPCHQQYSWAWASVHRRCLWTSSTTAALISFSATLATAVDPIVFVTPRNSCPRSSPMNEIKPHKFPILARTCSTCFITGMYASCTQASPVHACACTSFTNYGNHFLH